MPRSEDHAPHYPTRSQGRRATDSLFPNVSRKKVAEYLAIAIAVATVYGMLTTWVASRFATRAEIAPISQRIDTLATRVDDLEAVRRSDAEAAARQAELINGLVRLRCIEISPEKAFLANLPCESMLSPRQKQGRIP